MIDVQQAVELLDRTFKAGQQQELPLREARGSYLAQSVVADRDFPSSDRSAMDGYALRAEDSGARRVVGEIQAGADPAKLQIGAGEACRIFTGATLPVGADAVVMVEHCDEQGETVTVPETIEPGQHVRHRASDRPGGAPLLEQGRRIGAGEIAALASVGCDPVAVFRQPTIAVLSTGDELVPPHVAPQPYQIRDSNAPMVASLFAAHGFKVVSQQSVGDDREALRAAILEGLKAELLVVSGGVSVGDYDFVAAEFEAAGIEKLFHGMAMKPGKPIYAGRRGARAIFGLPGNPLSAYVGTTLFALPIAKRLAGAADPWPQTRQATLTGALRQRAGRQTYHPAKLDGDQVKPVRSTGSGDVLVLADLNAWIVLPAESSGAQEGDRVEVLPL